MAEMPLQGCLLRGRARWSEFGGGGAARSRFACSTGNHKDEDPEARVARWPQSPDCHGPAPMVILSSHGVGPRPFCHEVAMMKTHPAALGALGGFGMTNAKRGFPLTNPRPIPIRQRRLAWRFARIAERLRRISGAGGSQLSTAFEMAQATAVSVVRKKRSCRSNWNLNFPSSVVAIEATSWPQCGQVPSSISFWHFGQQVMALDSNAMRGWVR